MNQSAHQFRDSLVEQKEDSVRCEQCGAKTRVESGICVNCFLQEGLAATGGGCAETFSDVLDEVDLPDLHRQIGNYEILEGIGRGGMGVIYRAQQRYSRPHRRPQTGARLSGRIARGAGAVPARSRSGGES